MISLALAPMLFVFLLPVALIVGVGLLRLFMVIACR